MTAEHRSDQSCIEENLKRFMVEVLSEYGTTEKDGRIIILGERGALGCLVVPVVAIAVLTVLLAASTENKV